MKRLFLAINLSEATKDQLMRLIQDLRSKNSSSNIRWVQKRENLHLTLHFFGEIEEDKIAPMAQKLKEFFRQYSRFTLATLTLSSPRGRGD